MRLRPATWEDRGKLLSWREQDEANDWWKGEPVTKRQHNQWLWERLNNPAVRLWVCEVDGQDVGQVRIDSNGEISFSIDAGFRGQGYGSQMVAHAVMGCGWPRLKANVDLDNQASIRTLEHAGFRMRPDVGFMRWPE